MIAVNNSGSGAVYKGLALGAPESGPVLYAANFHSGAADIFGGDFAIKTLAGTFRDPAIPAGSDSPPACMLDSLAHGLLQPARRNFRDGHRPGLPVLARGVSMHAWGLRLRRVLRMLAMAHPLVLPSAMLNYVGTPVAIISQLNTRPACAPVNASMAALRLATHDSGPGWIAIPFLYDSFIHNSTPVYLGALSSLLVSHEVIVNLIAATKTKTGLHVQSRLDTGKYPRA